MGWKYLFIQMVFLCVNNVAIKQHTKKTIKKLHNLNFVLDSFSFTCLLFSESLFIVFSVYHTLRKNANILIGNTFGMGQMIEFNEYKWQFLWFK